MSVAAAAMLMTSSAFADDETPAGYETIVGAASFYDIPGETASGEQYDPKAFTAAAQLEIRDKFGGIKFGSLYRVSFAVAEYAGKKLILKFNDVGPLRPGRKFDLSRAAMEYFDGLDKGLLSDFKVTVLPLGQAYTPGPVTDEQLAALGFGKANVRLASAGPTDPGGSNAEQGKFGSPDAPIDLLPTTADLIDTCVDLARACEDTSTALAQSEPAATAPDDLGPANVQVAEAMRPTVDLDRWQAIETWSLRPSRYDGGQDDVCSSGEF